MAYKNIAPSPKVTLLEFIITSVATQIALSELDESILESIPVSSRQALISGLLAWSFIFDEDHAEHLEMLGESFSPGNSLEGLENNRARCKRSLSILAATWPYDYQQASAAINSLESAMFVFSAPAKSQLSEAFAPEGSKGFARVEQVAAHTRLHTPELTLAKYLEQLLGGPPSGPQGEMEVKIPVLS